MVGPSWGLVHYWGMERGQADEDVQAGFRESIEDAGFTDPVGLYNAANDLQRMSKADAIEVLYVLVIEAGVTEALLNYGTFLWGAGRLHDALVPLLKAHEAHDPGAAPTLGQIYLELNEPDEAIGWFHRAGDHPAVPVRLAYAHRARGDEQAALAVLHAGKDTNPEAAVELVLTGDLDTAEAISLLEHHVDAGHLDVLVPLANLYGQTHQKTREIAALRRAVAAGETHAVHNLGLVLWEAGHRQEGRSLLTAAARDGDQLASRALHRIKRKRHRKNPG